MELTEQAAWILSAVELNICINLLGRSDWADFPASYSSRSLNKRMLDSFLHLVQIGLIEPSDSGYRAAKTMKERLDPAVRPEQVRWSAPSVSSGWKLILKAAGWLRFRAPGRRLFWKSSCMPKPRLSKALPSGIRSFWAEQATHRNVSAFPVRIMFGQS